MKFDQSPGFLVLDLLLLIQYIFDSRTLLVTTEINCGASYTNSILKQVC